MQISKKQISAYWPLNSLLERLIECLSLIYQFQHQNICAIFFMVMSQYVLLFSTAAYNTFLISSVFFLSSSFSVKILNLSKILSKFYPNSIQILSYGRVHENLTGKKGVKIRVWLITISEISVTYTCLGLVNFFSSWMFRGTNAKT